ncbi:SGNH/GDSL hydrolase family protein [Pseudonocardia kongjuensis]|uniref:SGNH/GDSL hydrolase family protein n=1 Tax=Pseudonocardia kongjuensis TaxID=102227 RepID=A0ABN1XG73_9PSEU
MRGTARPVGTPVTAELVHGALELERTPVGIRPHRLPAAALARGGDPQLAMAEAQPSGVRLVAETGARSVELTVLTTRFGFRGLPARPPGVFELVVDGRPVARSIPDTAITVTVDPATGTRETSTAEPATIVFDDLPAGRKLVEIWLPHNETVEIAGLRADAALDPAPGRRPRWLHHGSSISHGSGADHPLGTWPAVAATAAGLDLVNLGFGGSALLDPFTARTIRDTPADLISIKIGINLVNADLMRLRAFGPAVHGFLDTIRDGHPDTPLVVVSPVHCPIHEDTPGPGAFDPAALARGELRFVATGDPAEVAAGKLTLRVVREQLARIVAERSADDPDLHHVDGLSLYGPDDAVAHPLPDDLHPDAATHLQMGERFAARLRAVRSPA